MNVQLSPSQLQKTILAPMLQQSVEVLLLPIAELTTAINLELQENPLLELDENEMQETDPIERLIELNLGKMLDAPSGQIYEGNPDDEEKEKFQIESLQSLEEHLINQINLECQTPEEFAIAEHIISSIDHDGYLKNPIEDIAIQLNTTEEKVASILKKVQSLDPIGIAASNLKECLIIQAQHKHTEKKDLICKLISEHFEDLGKKRYPLIASKLKVSVDTVKDLNHLISQLNPKPARNFRPLESNIYMKPDISLIKGEDGAYKIHMNKEFIPKLRISSVYRKLLLEQRCTADEKEFIKEKLKSAIQFIKSIEQRHQTLKEITKVILEHQQNFFEHGASELKPLILKDVAEKIERNESTVSRAISNKYIDCPQGLLPLKYFFSQGLSENGIKSVSNRSIKEEIKELIEDEDKESPLSDQSIQEYFEAKGLTVARRTISKYRQAIHILPSHLRKS